MSAVGACRRSVGPENWRVFMLRIKELCIFLWCVSHSLVALSDAHDGDIAMRIDSLMASHFPAAGEPGAAILIKCGDSIIIDKGYGVADIVSSQPIDGNTMFNIASISKQFTVVGILSLADKGLLSVGDSVAKYMPEYESGQWKKIRLSHLMSHSSGVPDLRRRLNREQMIYATDEESVAYLDTLRTFHFEPGAAYEYVNPTFLLLGNIIERVSGEKFEEFQQKNIFGRAAMKAIYFSPDIVIPNMAHGYVKNTSGGEHDSRNKVSFEGKIVRSDSAWKEYDYGENEQQRNDAFAGLLGCQLLDNCGFTAFVGRCRRAAVGMYICFTEDSVYQHGDYKRQAGYRKTVTVRIGNGRYVRVAECCHVAGLLLCFF